MKENAQVLSNIHQFRPSFTARHLVYYSIIYFVHEMHSAEKCVKFLLSFNYDAVAFTSVVHHIVQA